MSGSKVKITSEKWTNRKPPAWERRVMRTVWLGESWERLCNTVDITRMFEKVGIILTLDGAMDTQKAIQGAPRYTFCS